MGVLHVPLGLVVHNGCPTFGVGEVGVWAVLEGEQLCLAAVIGCSWGIGRCRGDCRGWLAAHHRSGLPLHPVRLHMTDKSQSTTIGRDQHWVHLAGY